MARHALAVLVLLVAGCAGPRAGGRPHVGATLQVSGEGRAAAAPDRVSFVVGVESFAREVAPAVAEADRRLRAVRAALGEGGVEARDLRTTRYDVLPERRYDPQAGGHGELVGYRVVHELQAVVRGGDAARAGVALDAATRGGANLLHSIRFEKEDLSAERARALEAAVGAARGKAQAIAAAAGRTLGDVTAVTEGGGRGPIVPLRGAKMVAAEAAAGAPLEAGELEVVAQVEVEFALR
jgi:uncharacterized protein YggE